ncbi:MAG TPA: helix-turn-helix domain-containing protein [Microbacterium sp.]|nr:helix-turn-helix domain-containing protein [Microbacterium sp.]
MVTRRPARDDASRHLQALPDDRDVQAFWESVEAQLDDLAARLIAEIRTELPSYQALPPQEQNRTVRELLGAMTLSLTTGELPRSERLQMIRASARRRAYYGMPIYDVLAAFHFAHRGLWATFRSSPCATERLLVELVEPMAAWAQAMSQAVVDAYVAEQGGRDPREKEMRSQLFDALDDPARDQTTVDVLRELAYDAEGEFTVVVSRHQAWTRENTAALQRSCRRYAGVLQIGARAGLAVLISQGMAIDDLASAAREIVGPVALGVGLPRTGLPGIRASIVDARRSLEVAESTDDQVVRFADQWFFATLLHSAPELDPLLSAATASATVHPDLADAVLAFADAGYSLVGAGERLRLNANSVSYRLGRWKEHTGLDVRDFSDLAASMLAVRRARSAR